MRAQVRHRQNKNPESLLTRCPRRHPQPRGLPPSTSLSPGIPVSRHLHMQIGSLFFIKRSNLPPQVFIFRPLHTSPSTTIPLHNDTQSNSSFLSTCPNHLSAQLTMTSSTPEIPMRFNRTALRRLPFSEPPHIRQIMLRSVLVIRCMSPTFIGHVSLP